MATETEARQLIEGFTSLINAAQETSAVQSNLLMPTFQIQPSENDTDFSFNEDVRCQTMIEEDILQDQDYDNDKAAELIQSILRPKEDHMN